MKSTSTNTLLWFTAIGLGFLSLAGAAEKKNISPFLGDISGFKRSEERKTMLIDRHPPKEAISYQKMMIEPVAILQSSHSEYRQLTPEEKDELSKLFRSYAVDSFKDVVEITDAPGAGVLDVRCAIRGLKQGRYHLKSSGSKNLKADSKMPAGTLEVEALDSMSKERIVALVDEIGKEKMAKTGKEEIVQTVSSMFHEWIDVLKNTFRQEKILSQIPK